MEREKLITNQGNGITQPWNPIPLNFSLNQFPNSLFNTNCENSLNQRDLFESALSSIVSSPANSHSGIPIPGNESIVLRELIGRLGNICNSGEISPQSCINGNKSNNTSCYNTPINSPPNLNLSITDNPIQGNHHHQLPFPIDPGFVERASRFSCFAGLKETGFPQVMESRSSSSTKDGIPDSNKKLVMSSTQEAMELGDSKEESSVSEQNPGGKTQCTNGRKRKMIPKGKGIETPSSTTKDDKGVAEVEKDGKRSKSDEEDKRKEKEKEKVEWNQKQTKECAKPPEPPKDYIHVRAKRGQATDSHSLAERVRREKISERMKFLQDLVPGCNKVTGKAVMLDEIINYVQALQRQVEFLSMKLATVNPRMDVTMETLLSKDMFRSRLSMPTNMNSFDNLTQPFPYGFQSQNGGMVLDGLENQFSMNTLMATMHRNSIMKPSHVDGFEEASMFWENDLQSVVKMALGQDQPQSFHGQMKVEL